MSGRCAPEMELPEMSPSVIEYLYEYCPDSAGPDMRRDEHTVVETVIIRTGVQSRTGRLASATALREDGADSSETGVCECGMECKTQQTTVTWPPLHFTPETVGSVFEQTNYGIMLSVAQLTSVLDGYQKDELAELQLGGTELGTILTDDLTALDSDWYLLKTQAGFATFGAEVETPIITADSISASVFTKLLQLLPSHPETIDGSRRYWNGPETPNIDVESEFYLD